MMYRKKTWAWTESMLKFVHKNQTWNEAWTIHWHKMTPASQQTRVSWPGWNEVSEIKDVLLATGGQTVKNVLFRLRCVRGEILIVHWPHEFQPMSNKAACRIKIVYVLRTIFWSVFFQLNALHQKLVFKKINP